MTPGHSILGGNDSRLLSVIPSTKRLPLGLNESIDSPLTAINECSVHKTIFLTAKRKVNAKLPSLRANRAFYTHSLWGLLCEIAQLTPLDFFGWKTGQLSLLAQVIR